MTGLTAVTVTRRLEEFGDQVNTVEQEFGQEQEFHQVNTMEQEFGLVVDGAALTLIMPLQENRDLLYQVLTQENRGERAFLPAATCKELLVLDDLHGRHL